MGPPQSSHSNSQPLHSAGRDRCYFQATRETFPRASTKHGPLDQIFGDAFFANNRGLWNLCQFTSKQIRREVDRGQTCRLGYMVHCLSRGCQIAVEEEEAEGCRGFWTGAGFAATLPRANSRVNLCIGTKVVHGRLIQYCFPPLWTLMGSA